MAKSIQKALLILGGFVVGVLLACAGLSALATWGLSSLFGEGEAEVTVAGQIDCPAGPVRVVNHHRVTNRLAGVTNDAAFVVVDGGDVPPQPRERPIHRDGGPRDPARRRQLLRQAPPRSRRPLADPDRGLRR